MKRGVRSFLRFPRWWLFSNAQFRQEHRWLTSFYHALCIYGALLFIICFYLYNYMLFTSSWQFYNSESSARFVMLGDPQMEGHTRITREGWYGELAVWMNDVYFRHIMDNIMAYIQPSHIFVLGDIFSYQGLSDTEFENRVSRYNWIFQQDKILNGEVKLINISGNHDIGYGNEVDEKGVARFESVFGPVNDRIYVAGHILGIVNAMNIDEATNQDLRQQTWDHMNSLALEREQTQLPLILFTHIPLHKPEGICVEPPMIRRVPSTSAVIEQHMLSENSSNYILDVLKPVIIFTGHDHAGCTYVHNNYTKEYTVRSVMGDFGGYTAVLEIFETEPVQGDLKRNFVYREHNTSFIIMQLVTAVIVCLCILVVLALGLLLVLVVGRATGQFHNKKKQ